MIVIIKGNEMLIGHSGEYFYRCFDFSMRKVVAVIMENMMSSIFAICAPYISPEMVPVNL